MGIIGAAVSLPTATPMSIASGLAYVTAIAFTTEIFDTNGMWDVGQPTRLTCTRAGIYILTASAAFVTNAAGGRGAALFMNSTAGSFLMRSQSAPPPNSFWGGAMSVVQPMVVGDYVELYVQQDSGGNLNTAYSFLTALGFGQS